MSSHTVFTCDVCGKEHTSGFRIAWNGPSAADPRMRGEDICTTYGCFEAWIAKWRALRKTAHE